MWRWRPSIFGLLVERVELSADDDVMAALQAGLGLRAAMDMVLSDTVGDDERNFFEKLDRFEALGLIGKTQRDQFAAALDVGHAAAHRGYAPPSDDLEHVVDILENVLISVYKLKDAAIKLKRNTPRQFPRGV